MSSATLAAPVHMSPADRAATEAYLADLEAEFRTNAVSMWAAKTTGDTDTYERTVETSRSLYREISEVEVALKAGILPF